MTGPASRTQVNIRLDTREAEVLAAVAFLTETSAAEVLRPLVRDFLQAQEEDPDVKAALEIRARRRGSTR
jgi:hypothetical protein